MKQSSAWMMFMSWAFTIIIELSFNITIIIVVVAVIIIILLSSAVFYTYISLFHFFIYYYYFFFQLAKSILIFQFLLFIHIFFIHHLSPVHLWCHVSRPSDKKAKMWFIWFVTLEWPTGVTPPCHWSDHWWSLLQRLRNQPTVIIYTFGPRESVGYFGLSIIKEFSLISWLGTVSNRLCMFTAPPSSQTSRTQPQHRQFHSLLAQSVVGFAPVWVLQWDCPWHMENGVYDNALQVAKKSVHTRNITVCTWFDTLDLTVLRISWDCVAVLRQPETRHCAALHQLSLCTRRPRWKRGRRNST